MKDNFRLRQPLKRIDDGQATFVSFDMTEITKSEEEFDCLKMKMLQSLRERSISRRPPQLVDATIQPCSSSLSVASEMSDRARDILTKAFPGVSFDDEALGMDKDLTQYPDPDDQCIQMLASNSSDEEDDDDDGQDGKHVFRGLLIDTSVCENTPGPAQENDEYLIYSPPSADATDNKNMESPPTKTVSSPNESTPKAPEPTPPTEDVIIKAPVSSLSVQPRNKLAHIFTEELSTLYEQDENASVTSIEDDYYATHQPKKAELLLDDYEVSPNERSIHNRWNNILEMTITGQCADQRFVVMDEEAEI